MEIDLIHGLIWYCMEMCYCYAIYCKEFMGEEGEGKGRVRFGEWVGL